MAEEVKSGFAFHIHHDQLIEFCTDYQERVDYIKENKPADEVELRLKLFKLIPLRRLPRKLVEVGRAHKEAWKAWKACSEAGEALCEAAKAINEAKREKEEAEETYEPQLIKLHEELCPGCPWNGKTIFTNNKGDK